MLDKASLEWATTLIMGLVLGGHTEGCADRMVLEGRACDCGEEDGKTYVFDDNPRAPAAFQRHVAELKEKASMRWSQQSPSADGAWVARLPDGRPPEMLCRISQGRLKWHGEPEWHLLDSVLAAVPKGTLWLRLPDTQG